MVDLVTFELSHHNLKAGLAEKLGIRDERQARSVRK